MKKIKKLLYVLLVVLLIGIIAFISLRPKSTISSEKIKEKIENINELATVSYEYTKVIKYENSKKIFDFNIPLTNKGYIVTFDGKVKVGFDLSEATIDINEKTINITLPEAKILSNEIDQDTMQILDEKNGFFNKLTLDDYSDFETTAKEEVIKDVEDKGLYDQARSNVEKYLKEVMFDDYEIVIS